MEEIDNLILSKIRKRATSKEYIQPLLKDRRPILLLDQDDVLADYLSAVVSEYNKTFNTNYSKSDITDWKIADILGEEVYNILFDPTLFLNLEPIQGAITGIKELLSANLFDIYIVTAAHPAVINNKYIWISKNMPFFNKQNIIFTSQKHLVKGDILVDDGLHNIKEFNNGEPIIFTQPHNIKEKKYKRVDNWIELIDYLLDKFYPLKF